MRDGDVVHVVWVDAARLSGWRDAADVGEAEGTVCETIGFLVKQSREAVVVAMTRGCHDVNQFAGDELGDVMFIPRGMVVRMTAVARTAVVPKRGRGG